jgi:hypothetical protein
LSIADFAIADCGLQDTDRRTFLNQSVIPANRSESTHELPIDDFFIAD